MKISAEIRIIFFIVTSLQVGIEIPKMLERLATIIPDNVDLI